MTGRAACTRQRITDCALQLFSERGFDGVTVNEIAAAARVSHMTVFRHFPTKEDLVVSDPFDPLLASAVAAQPTHLAPLERTRRGLQAGWAAMQDHPELDDTTLRLRVGLACTHPGLRARMSESNRATAQAIAAVLREGGASPIAAEAAAGACLGALTAALLAWGAHPEGSFSDTILAALDALAPAGHPA